MDSPHLVSRRGLLTAAAAGSAIALTTSASALAATNSSTPASNSAASLVSRDRIATALTRLPDGRAAVATYTVDFHDRLSEWIRFWWANAPAAWHAPMEVVGEVTASGRAYLLSALRVTSVDRLTTGFSATTRDPAYWATLASLHRFFPVVRPDSGRVRIEDGESSFTGSAVQLEFVRDAHRHVWRGDPAMATVTTRTGWQTFTKDTLRLGLGTESS